MQAFLLGCQNSTICPGFPLQNHAPATVFPPTKHNPSGDCAWIVLVMRMGSWQLWWLRIGSLCLINDRYPTFDRPFGEGFTSHLEVHLCYSYWWLLVACCPCVVHELIMVWEVLPFQAMARALLQRQMDLLKAQTDAVELWRRTFEKDNNKDKKLNRVSNGKSNCHYKNSNYLVLSTSYRQPQ